MMFISGFLNRHHSRVHRPYVVFQGGVCVVRVIRPYAFAHLGVQNSSTLFSQCLLAVHAVDGALERLVQVGTLELEGGGDHVVLGGPRLGVQHNLLGNLEGRELPPGVGA